jgi:hypothetical protein
MDVHEGEVRSHRKNRVCKIRRRAFELEKRGLVSVDGHHDRPPKMLRTLLERAGIECEVAPSHYRSGITFYSTFAPAWVATIYILTRPTPGASWAGFRRVFETLRTDPELRDAVLAANQINLQMVINLLRQQGIIEPA